jgi:hypothetical protein
MKQRALELKVLAAFLISMAVGFPIQIMLQYEHGPTELLAIGSKLTPLNWAVILLALVTAATAIEASRWIIVSAPAMIAAIAWNNSLFALVDANYTGFTASSGTLAVLLAHGVLLRPAPIKLLINPHLRWWRAASRLRVQMKTSIHPVTGGDITARAYDVSVSGAFYSLDHVRWLTPSGTTIPNQIVPGVRCALRLDLDRYQTIYCSGQIVRKTEPKGDKPAGFAVQFIGMSPGDRRKLGRFLGEFGPGAVSAAAA